MKKQVLISLSVIAAVAAVAMGGTMALFSDTETSNGNIFTAGAIDLKVDHTYASYNGEECNECEVLEGAENLIVNGGFEDPSLPNNSWQVYPDGIPGWEASDAGIEVQHNAAGASHLSNQHVELDSHGSGSSSAMEQVIDTVPGQKYRLIFWHSPRPNNGPADDNAVELKLLVTSTSGNILNEVIGNPSLSNSGTVWTEYVRDFVALDSETTIGFSDAGSEADTLGGYLDDVSVVALDCPVDTYTNTPGGTCKLWAEKDLRQGDTFWNFTDVKPGDWGENTISLHVYDNDAFVCLMPSDIDNQENGLVDPELALADTAVTGELSQFLEFFMWNDENANNVYDNSEDIVVEAGTLLGDLETQNALELSSPAPVTLLGVNWCAGNQTGPSEALPNTPINCDGSAMGNIAQTDKVMADFVAYAVQQRNNEEFSCEDVNLEEEVIVDRQP